MTNTTNAAPPTGSPTGAFGSLPNHGPRNPYEYAALLAKKLGSRERHICFLLGAGTGKAAGLPDIARLQTDLEARYANGAQKALAKLLKSKGVEGCLTWLRKVESLLDGSGGKFDGLDEVTVREFDHLLCKDIMEILSSAPTNLTSFQSLSRWLTSTDYSRPVELFTLSYDLLVEQALESESVPYFDGFLGTYEGSFRADLVDAFDPSDPLAVPAFFTRLWKLHGSFSWMRNGAGRVVRLGRKAEPSEMMAIHPSENKYEDSRRSPYVILFDRFRRALLEPETLLVVSGYSFGDQHVNEVIFDAIRSRPRSEFVFLMYGDIPDELTQIAEKWANVSAASPRSSIVGGIRVDWETPEDQSAHPSIWSESGGFRLGDFSSLSAYLAQNVTGGWTRESMVI